MTPDDIATLGARTPFVAHEMIYEYILTRRRFLEEVEVLDIERPFAVPLTPDNPDLFYVGRLDKMFKKRGDIHTGEHKTTSMYKANGGFKANFVDSFSPNSQVDGYSHAGHMIYGEEYKGVWVDGALVHKKVHDQFIFIPMERQFSQMDAWLWETLENVKAIEYNTEKLYNAAEGQFLAAFPRNTSNCQDFMRNCEYIDICKGFANPHQITETPMGFVEEAWSPFERLELEKIGLKEK
jgi:hypothetical protein